MRSPFKKQEWGGFKAAHSLDALYRVYFYFLEDSRCLPSSQELDNCMKWYWSALTHQCKALNGLFKHRINVFPFWKKISCWLKKLWSGEMVHWVKGRTAKSDNVSVITRTHVVEDGNWVPQVVLWWPHSCRGTSQTSKQMACFLKLHIIISPWFYWLCNRLCILSCLERVPKVWIPSMLRSHCRAGRQVDIWDVFLDLINSFHQYSGMPADESWVPEVPLISRRTQHMETDNFSRVICWSIWGTESG